MNALNHVDETSLDKFPIGIRLLRHAKMIRYSERSFAAISIRVSECRHARSLLSYTFLQIFYTDLSGLTFQFRVSVWRMTTKMLLCIISFNSFKNLTGILGTSWCVLVSRSWNSATPTVNWMSFSPLLEFFFVSTTWCNVLFTIFKIFLWLTIHYRCTKHHTKATPLNRADKSFVSAVSATRSKPQIERICDADCSLLH